MKKRNILSLIAIMLVLFSLLSLTACSDTKVDDINGKSASEIFEIAYEELEDTRYDIKVGITTTSKIWIVPIYTWKVKHMVTYCYDGDNEAYIITDELYNSYKKEDMGDAYEDFGPSYYHINGDMYVKESYDGSFGIDNSYYSAEKSEYEQAVNEILRENVGTVQCYKKGNSYYFTIEITDASETKMDNEWELYTVYLNKDGRIEKIVVESKFSELFVTAETEAVLTYVYDGLEPITAPAN